MTPSARKENSHFKMDTMRKYATVGDFHYWGKSYDIIMNLTCGIVLFLPRTYTVCTFDRYFTSHPLLFHLSAESMHGFGTIPKDRKYLPPDKNDIWEEVKLFKTRGEYISLHCKTTGIVLGVHRSAKVTGVMSNYHSDDGENSIGRYNIEYSYYK